MKKIILTQGQFTIVDDDDFEKFGKFTWHAHWCEYTASYYARRNALCHEYNKRTTVLLHREIMGNPPGKLVDHKNHDTLDNRKENLRPCTGAENRRNRKGAQENSATGIRGVYWNKRLNKFTVSIQIDKKQIHLGCFKTIAKAVEVRKEANKKYYGEFGGNC